MSLIKAGWRGAFLAASMVVAGATTVGHAQVPAPPAKYLVAHEPQRLALVVGNADYANFERLPGSRADGEAMRDLLTRLGFKVDYVENADTFDNFADVQLKAFSAKIQEGDLVVFYFSGHGFAHGPDNYLVPTRAPPTIRPQQLNEAFLPEAAIRAHLKERNPAVIIALLDACRTYAGIVSAFAPLHDPGASPALAPDAAPGATGEGLLEPVGLGSDEIIGFAARPGKPATGYVEGASRYTAALLQQMDQEGWELDHVRDRVIYAVKSTTTPPQEPWFSDSLISLVFFKPSQETKRQELESWKAALATGERAKVKEYLAFNAVGSYAHAARKWLRENPTDVRPTFSQVSPLQAELAWKAPVAGDRTNVVFDRLPAGIGVARRLNLSDRWVVPTSLSEATNEVLLRLHRTARLTQSIEGMTAAGARLLDRGIPLRVTDAFPDAIRAEVTPMLGAAPVSVVLKSEPQSEGLRVGAPFAEVGLRPPAGGFPGVVDPTPLQAELSRLRKGNRQVGWISISTPRVEAKGSKVERARTQGLLGLRATQVKYLVQASGVPESKISVIEGLGEGSDIRVRIYAF